MYITQFNNIRKFENNSTTNTVETNSLAYMYYKANNITSVDYTYFSENSKITDISYIFAYSSITSINTNTFKYLKNLTTVDGAFKGCTVPSETVINFSNSPNISSATDFLDTPANYTIIVPVDSVTETTFTNLGYNIIQGDVFKFTVDTTKISATNKISGIPFTLYNQTSGTTLTVNWGDGNTSTLTSSNYSSSSTTASNHTYSTAGTYTISIKCNNWDGLRLMCVNVSSAPSSSYNRSSNMYYFKKTLISFDSPIPHLLGAYVLSSYGSSSWYSYTNPFAYCTFAYCEALTTIHPYFFLHYNNDNITTLEFCFYKCSSLTSIPTGLFDNIISITSFQYCFSYCSSLTSIPADLFRYNTAVTSFQQCFQGCSSLASIPTDLFKYNTAVTNFQSCFSSCSSITSIPTDLFKYNTAVTNFSNCFTNCNALTSIPTDLFRYNTAVTNFSNCFSGCSALNDFTIHIGSTLVSTVTSFVTNKAGTTRTVYVPAGSTTKTKFDSVASSLGLTIIAE